MIPPKKPEDFTLLLAVFDYGLKHGIVSTHDVVAWADQIIMSEDEPDYFFIELSLCSDNYGLISIIEENVSTELNVISIRVIFSLIYYKIRSQTISREKAIRLIYYINAETSIVTSWERLQIYLLDDEFDRSFEAEPFLENILAFLSIYQAFNLCNHGEWDEVNEKVEGIINPFDEELAKQREGHNEPELIWQIKAFFNSRQRYALLGGIFFLFLLCFIIILNI